MVLVVQALCRFNGVHLVPNLDHCCLAQINISMCQCFRDFSGPNSRPCTACQVSQYKNTNCSSYCTPCLANSGHQLLQHESSVACQFNTGY